MSDRLIPQLLHGMPIINPDGTPTKWFVDAWNDLLDRTGGQAVNLVGNIINGRQELADINLAGSSLSVTLQAVNSNIDSTATEAAAGSGGLVVSISPSLASGRSDTSVVTSNTVTASVTGGVAPYTYTLTKVSGDTIDNVISGANNNIVQFSQTMTVGQTLTAQYRWTVEDSTGTPLTGNKSFSVTMTRDEFVLPDFIFS